METLFREDWSSTELFLLYKHQVNLLKHFFFYLCESPIPLPIFKNWKIQILPYSHPKQNVLFILTALFRRSSITQG